MLAQLGLVALPLWRRESHLAAAHSRGLAWQGRFAIRHVASLLSLESP